MNRGAFTRVSELNDGELVSRPFRVIRWPLVGGSLDVPAGHQAVLTNSKGDVHVSGEGLQGLRDLACGVHTVQLVDVRRRHLELPSVAALTQDGWRASIQASVEYRIRSPHAVVQLDEPLKTLREAAVFALISTIKTMPHDLLLGTADQSANQLAGHHEAIAARTQKLLQANLRGSGLEVVNVFISQPEGDERRLEIWRESQIGEVQFDVEQMALGRQMELERERQALALLQAETRRKQAEEEQRIRLEQARIEAEVTHLVQSVREWEARLQLEPDLRRQRHEQILEAIKAYGHILGKMAELGNLEVLGVSSRRRPEELGLDRLETIVVQGLVNLQSLLAQESLALVSGNGDAIENLGQPLLVRLTNEINELSTIEGLTWTHLRPANDGGLCLETHLDGIMLEITCRPDFPITRPEIVVSVDDHQRVPFLFPWSQPRPLKELVLEVAHRFSAATLASSAPAA